MPRSAASTALVTCRASTGCSPARGLLEEAWQAAGPFLASGRGAVFVDELGHAAERAAAWFPQYAFPQVERARPVVEQLWRALPRNLVLAVALSGNGVSAGSVVD